MSSPGRETHEPDSEATAVPRQGLGWSTLVYKRPKPEGRLAIQAGSYLRTSLGIFTFMNVSCIGTENLKQRISRIFKYASLARNSDGPRASVSLSGGIIATKPCTMGSLVFSERPIFVVPLPLLVAHTDLDAWVTECLRRAYNQLPLESQNVFNGFAEGVTTDPTWMRNVIMKWGLDMVDLCSWVEAPSFPSMGVFELSSRLQHNCGPNAVAVWNAESFAIEVYAVRPIQQGEEVTISFITDLLHSAKERFQKLGFECACRFCKRPRAIQSDLTRRTLCFDAILLPSLIPTWFDDLSLPKDWLAKQCMRSLVLMQREGLQGMELYGMYLIAGYLALWAINDPRYLKWKLVYQRWALAMGGTGQESLALSEAPRVSRRYKRRISSC